jgi:hypothetical protein
MKKRAPYINVWKELSYDKAMIFLAGPRQSGKTTLTKIIAASFSNSLYWNWDIVNNRTHLLQDPGFFSHLVRKDNSVPLIIFDELHKYKDWKNYLKGVYDEFSDEFKFLISGSGRLDIYQKGGDSLAGRVLSFSSLSLHHCRTGRHEQAF